MVILTSNFYYLRNSSFSKLSFTKTERIRILADSKTNPRGQSRPRDGSGGGKGMPGGQLGGRL